MNRQVARRFGVSLLLAALLTSGSVASVQTGLIVDDPTEQITFDKITGAVNNLRLGHLDEFKQLQSYDQKYYGIGFYLAAHPFQVLLQPYIARALAVDNDTAHLLARRPLVFLLFVISVIVFYRIARFFIRERFIAIVIAAAYAAYPYLFGHAMINIKDSPFMSAYLICTYLSLRLAKSHLQGTTNAVLPAVAGLACATAFLASIRIPGFMILVQYGFTFALTEFSKLGGKSRTKLLRWQNLVCFSAVVIPLVVLAYPALWLNPLHGVLAALKFMGWLPQPGCTLTWGQCMPPYATPTYLLGWFVVKLPALTLIGLMFIPFALKKIIQDPFQRVAYLTILFGSLYVLIVIVALRARLYDETRQLLFLYPLLFLAGAIAIYFVSRKLLLIAALVCLPIFCWDQLSLHPYQYVYFNEAARFLDVDELFETDYWGTSGAEHARLLSRNLNELNGVTCVFTDLPYLYRPFINPNLCLESLDALTEYSSNSLVVAITCPPNRFKVPANCHQLSAITRTLPPSSRKITMAIAYNCNR